MFSNDETKERLIANACVALGIAAYPLAFVLPAGIASAVVSLVLGFYQNYTYGAKTRVRVGMWLAAIFLAIILTYLILSAIYFRGLGLTDVPSLG